MKLLRITAILIVAMTIIFTGCSGSGLTPPVPVDSDVTILVANSLGETLSLVERTDGVWSVQKDIMPTGQGANDIVVDGDMAYIICSLSNSIHVVNTQTLETVREISTGEGTNPFAGAIDDDGFLWVTLTLSNQLVKVDAGGSGLVLQTVDLPDSSQFHSFLPLPNSPWPTGLCIAGGKIYVAFSNLSPSYVAGGMGGIGVLDVATGNLEDVIILDGMNTSDAINTPDGHVMFISTGMYSITIFSYLGNGLAEIYDPITSTITASIPIQGAPFEAVFSDTGAVYLTDGSGSEIHRFDSSTLTLWPPISIPDSGTGWNYISGICLIAGDEIGVLEFNGNKLFIVDGITGNIIQSLDVGHGPDALHLI